MRLYGLDLMIVLAAFEAALEIALRRDAVDAPVTATWFAAPAAAAVVALLLARRQLPFLAPASLWLLAAALSFVDGRLVVFSVSVYAAGMAAALLLGRLPDARQGRIGLAIVLGGAAIVVVNDPDHPNRAVLFLPVLVAIALPGR